MKNNRCSKLTALLLVMLMAIGMLTMSSMAEELKKQSGDFGVDFLMEEAQLDDTFVQSATIQDAQGNSVADFAGADPNEPYILKLEVSESYDSDSQAELLPDNTNRVRLFYQLENMTAKDGENEDVSWTYDARSKQLVFKWKNGKKSSFSAAVSVVPQLPETLGLNGRQFVIARMEGNNRGVVLPEAMSATNLKMDTSAKDDSGLIRYDSFEDPMWLFTHVTGDWYYISNNGRYITIDNASIKLSGEPFAIHVQKKNAKYFLSYKDYAFDAPSGNPVNGLTAYKTGKQEFYLYGVDQIATNPSFALEGSYVIATVKTNRFNLLLDKPNPGYTDRLASAQFKLSGNTVVPYGEYVKWNFEHITRDWYYISNGNGQYLQITNSGVNTTGERVPTLVRSNGSQYAFSGLGAEKAYLNNESDNTEKGFTIVTNTAWMWMNIYSSVDVPTTYIPDGEWMITSPARHFALSVNKENNSQEKVSYQDLTGMTGIVKLPNGKEPTYWSFERVDGNFYYIKSNGKYLNFANGSYGISDQPQRIAVYGENGQYIISDGEKYHLNADGNGVFKGYYENEANKIQKVTLNKAYDSLVMFDINGGNNNTTPVTGIVKAGDKITLPNYTGTRGNYEFIGWAETSDIYANNKYHVVYLPGTEFTVPSEKTTLYAVYNLKGTEVRFFIRKDGTIPDEPGDYPTTAYGTEMKIDDTLKKGYWIIDIDSNRQIAGNHIENAVTANLKTLPTDEQLKANIPSYDPETQYVHWYVLKYAGTWHVDGVIRNREQDSVTYFTNVEGTEKEQVKNMPVGFQTGNEEVKAGDNSSGKSFVPSREGYIFLGWNTEADGTGTAYKTGDEVPVEGQVNLYAQWDDILTVQIHSNVENQDKVYVGTEIVLTGIRGGSYKGDVTIRWEREDPITKERTEIEGANTMEYRFIIDADNAKYRYYVVLTPIQ